MHAARLPEALDGPVDLTLFDALASLMALVTRRFFRFFLGLGPGAGAASGGGVTHWPLLRIIGGLSMGVVPRCWSSPGSAPIAGQSGGSGSRASFGLIHY